MYDKIQDIRSRWGLSKMAQKTKVLIAKPDDLSFGYWIAHDRTISNII